MLALLLAALAAVLALALVVPFLVPVPPLAGVPPHTLAGPGAEFVSVRGVDLHGVDLHLVRGGAGEPRVLLLHGFGASTFSWERALRRFPGEAVAFDRPGFGLSQRPLNVAAFNPYSAAGARELTVGLLDALGWERAVLVGNSAGGTVALNVALAAPERVRALVLVGAAVYQGGGTPAWLRPLLRTPQAERLGPLLVRSLAGPQGDAFLRQAWSDPARLTGADLAGYRRPLQAENWDRALWEIVKASSEGVSSESDLAPRLNGLRVPVLVVSGANDRIVSPALSRRLANDIPGAVYAELPDCGHLPQEECPDAFVAVVNEFLRGLP